jgi:hypothetical protein
VPDLGLRAVAQAGPALPSHPSGCVSVVVEADRLAYGVRVQASGFVPDDDGFVLVPGTPRTIVLRPRGEAAFAGAVVTALNLIGETPVAAPE